VMNAILDLQAGHTSMTAAAEYAISSEDHGFVSREAMHQYFLASKAWYELLLQQEMGKHEKRAPITSTDGEIQGSIDMAVQENGSRGNLLSTEDVSQAVIAESRRQETLPDDVQGISR
jgi:hypothetical protein